MYAALARARIWRPASQAFVLAWAEAERGRLMPWLAVLMAAGVLLYFDLPSEPPAYAGPALAALCLLLALLLSRSRARAVGAAALCLAAGFASAQLATRRAPPLLSLPRTAVVFTGTVQSVEVRPEGRRLTLGAVMLGTGETLARTVHVTLPDRITVAAAAGDVFRLRAVLRPPAPPAYPGAWDLQRDAFFAGLGASGVALSPVVPLARAMVAGPGHRLTALREAIADRFRAGLPGPSGAIAATLFTGLGTASPQAERDAFRDSGLSHLLAVAGLHIGIVMGLVMGAARLGLALSQRAALRWPCKPLAAGCALAAGGCYVLLTGMHVPVLRSFAMAALVTLGIATGRRALSMRSLALAAIALMLIAPWQVVGVSFQMSFAAVMALIAGYEWLRPALLRIRRRRALHHLVTLALTSLLAGAASAPFAAYHFGRVQLFFILANLIAVPLAALLVMPAGLLALALMPLGLEHLALVPMGWGLDLILLVAGTTAALPAASLLVPHMPGWGLALVAFGIAWLCLWRSPLRLAGTALLAAGLLSGLLSPPADLLVSADARLIALRSPGLLQVRPGYAHFVQEAWQQYWAEPLDATFPESGAPGPVRCDPDGCRIRQGGATVLLARSLKPMDCSSATLVVSAEPARGICPRLPRIDRFTVWRDGAHAIWLRGGAADVISDRSWRGARPWVPPPPTSRPARTTLPLALPE